jgi:hypothetical protein
MEVDRRQKLRALVPLVIGSFTTTLSNMFIADAGTRHIVGGIGAALGLVGVVFAAPLIRRGLSERFGKDSGGPPSLR